MVGGSNPPGATQLMECIPSACRNASTGRYERLDGLVKDNAQHAVSRSGIEPTIGG